MDNLVLQSKLNKELLDAGFLLATQAQIAKDFSEVNSIFASAFKDEARNFEELLDQVELSVSKQLELGERPFLQLLYRIDIPESVFMDLCTDLEFVHKMSTKIIYREAYKVYLRAKFSA